MGLIDGFGDDSYVAREIIKAEKIVDMTEQTSSLAFLAKRLGSAIVEQLSWSIR